MEGSPISVVEKPNPNVTVEFEKDDLSIGAARFTGAKPVNKNLSMKPSLKGHPDNPIAHANVEVHLHDDKGNEVPMTRRLVRYWLVQPQRGATVQNLRQWRIVGLEHSEFSPFSPFPVARNERPAQTNFGWDRPGAKDAPGVQGLSVKDKPFGQLQEFLVGNAEVGGAYYQIYTLEDGLNVRVISSRELTFSAREYRELLRMIDSGEYSKTMGRKLLFMPAASASNITPYPKTPQTGSK